MFAHIQHKITDKTLKKNAGKKVMRLG